MYTHTSHLYSNTLMTGEVASQDPAIKQPCQTVELLNKRHRDLSMMGWTLERRNHNHIQELIFALPWQVCHDKCGNLLHRGGGLIPPSSSHCSQVGCLSNSSQSVRLILTMSHLIVVVLYPDFTTYKSQGLWCSVEVVECVVTLWRRMYKILVNTTLTLKCIAH